jgi:hypothetical protein
MKERMMPERVQLSRRKGWRKPENTVVVARPTKYGNPFRVDGGTVFGLPWETVRERFGKGTGIDSRTGDEDILTVYVSASSTDLAIVEAVGLFRSYCTVFERDEPERFARWIRSLCGHDLGCWCPLDQPCHADVLLEIANADGRAAGLLAVLPLPWSEEPVGQRGPDDELDDSDGTTHQGGEGRQERSDGIGHARVDAVETGGRP